MRGSRFPVGWLCLLVLALSCHGNISPEALYEQGMSEYAEGRLDDAVVSLTRALEESDGQRDAALIPHILLALADTYNNTYFYEEGYAAADSALQSGLRSGDMLLVADSRERMAQSLTGLGDWQRADSLYAANLTESALSTEAQARALAGQAYISVRYRKDPVRAASLFDEALVHSATFGDLEHWAAYAYSLAATGRAREAEAVFSDLEEAGLAESWMFQEWKSRLTALQGDYLTAWQLLERSAQQQRAGVMRLFRQSAVKAQRDYYALQSREARLHERSRLIIGLLVIALLVLLLSAGAILFRIREKRNRTERASLLDWAASMENQRDALSLSQARLRSDYARLYRSYFQQVGRINEIVQSSTDKERGVYYQLSRMIKDIRLDKRGQNQFEAMINRDLDGIMQHFREDYTGYQEDTYRFVSYVFAGFDAPSIRLLMDMGSEAAVYTKKSGIKKAIAASDSPWRDRYLMLL